MKVYDGIIKVYEGIWGCGKTHKIFKNNKFAKSPSSLGGIPIFRFLIHMAIIKDQESVLEMAWGTRYENFINKKIHIP